MRDWKGITLPQALVTRIYAETYYSRGGGGIPGQVVGGDADKNEAGLAGVHQERRLVHPGGCSYCLLVLPLLIYTALPLFIYTVVLLIYAVVPLLKYTVLPL
jgi:hypothetical protein